MTPQEQPSTCICGNLKCDIPFGYCHCGCRRKTRIARQSLTAYGHIKGMPHRFISGHSMGHRRPDDSILGHFKIDGVYCRLVSLTRGQWAIVNESDYAWISKFSWYAAWVTRMGCYYAARHLSKKSGGMGKIVYMHREILGLVRGDGVKVDHVDVWSTTDNRRNNLRRATVGQNAHNMRRHKRNTTGVKGVHQPKNRKYLVVHLCVDGKQMHIGTAKTLEEGSKMHHEAALKYHKRFARD